MIHGEASRELLEWPDDRCLYLTLDLECDYGTALTENRYSAVERVDELISLIERRHVPLTVFVQTEVLDERPEAVEALRATDVSVEFHSHSHTHAPRSETSVPREVTRSAERFCEFFGTRPKGYRFPNGNVRPEDYAVLAEAGYEFDASLSPSWRPGYFDHRDEPTVPYRETEHDVYEVPFTVFCDRARIPTSLSYCRLLGRLSLPLLRRYPGTSIVFNVHMHDLFNSESLTELSPLYRTVYSRTTDGAAMLERVIDTFTETGYSFGRFEELLRTVSNRGEERRTGLDV